jgi:hypothetical protein
MDLAAAHDPAAPRKKKLGLPTGRRPAPPRPPGDFVGLGAFSFEAIQPHPSLARAARAVALATGPAPAPKTSPRRPTRAAAAALPARSFEAGLAAALEAARAAAPAPRAARSRGPPRAPRRTPRIEALLQKYLPAEGSGAVAAAGAEEGAAGAAEAAAAPAAAEAKLATAAAAPAGEAHDSEDDDFMLAAWRAPPSAAEAAAAVGEAAAEEQAPAAWAAPAEPESEDDAWPAAAPAELGDFEEAAPVAEAAAPVVEEPTSALPAAVDFEELPPVEPASALPHAPAVEAQAPLVVEPAPLLEPQPISAPLPPLLLLPPAPAPLDDLDARLMAVAAALKALPVAEPPAPRAPSRGAGVKSVMQVKGEQDLALAAAAAAPRRFYAAPVPLAVAEPRWAEMAAAREAWLAAQHAERAETLRAGQAPFSFDARDAAAAAERAAAAAARAAAAPEPLVRALYRAAPLPPATSEPRWAIMVADEALRRAALGGDAGLAALLGSCWERAALAAPPLPAVILLPARPWSPPPAARAELGIASEGSEVAAAEGSEATAAAPASGDACVPAVAAPSRGDLGLGGDVMGAARHLRGSGARAGDGWGLVDA